jgi:hypothetical protein
VTDTEAKAYVHHASYAFREAQDVAAEKLDAPDSQRWWHAAFYVACGWFAFGWPGLLIGFWVYYLVWSRDEALAQRDKARNVWDTYQAAYAQSRDGRSVCDLDD